MELPCVGNVQFASGEMRFHTWPSNSAVGIYQLIAAPVKAGAQQSKNPESSHNCKEIGVKPIAK